MANLNRIDMLFSPTGRSLAGVCVLLFSAGVTASNHGSDRGVSAADEPVTEVATIQVEILSRGRGVPEPALRAYQDIRALAEQGIESGTEIRLNT